MKTGFLFKQNVDALLRSRHQSRHDLAFYCRRSDAWLSKILGKDERNLPMKYLDRIADFFGLAVYQLFQPGISPITERRKVERRSGKERRVRPAVGAPATVSARDINLSAEDIAFLLQVRSLSRRDRAELEKTAREAGRIRRKAAPNTKPDGVAVSSDPWPTGTTPRVPADGRG